MNGNNNEVHTATDVYRCVWWRRWRAEVVEGCAERGEERREQRAMGSDIMCAQHEQKSAPYLVANFNQR
jgi:hypothetical protein